MHRYMSFRKRPTGGSPRWYRVFVGVILLVSILAGTQLSSAAGDGVFGLLWFTDSYNDLTKVNTASTTADVDTAAGEVRLPHVAIPQPATRTGPHRAAIQPGGGRVALVVPSATPGKFDVACYQFSGQQLRLLVTWSAPTGVIRSVAWTGDGSRLIVATDANVTVLELDAAESFHQVATLNTPTIDVASGPRRDFWITDGTALFCLAWSGSSYRQVPLVPTATFTLIQSISTDPDSGTLVLLDAGSVRYFAAASGIGVYREVPANAVAIGGALAVATEAGGGYRVLVDDGQGTGVQTRHVRIEPGGGREVSGERDALPDSSVGLAASPWGATDYAALTTSGLHYRSAAGGGGWRDDPGRSLSATWWQNLANAQYQYAADAVLVSSVINVNVPIGRVITYSDAANPTGTSFNYDVSTDGGATWTQVPIGVVRDVSLGYAFAYRIRLHTADPQESPVVRFTDIRQVFYQDGPAREAGIQSHVKLVR